MSGTSTEPEIEEQVPLKEGEQKNVEFGDAFGVSKSSPNFQKNFSSGPGGRFEGVLGRERSDIHTELDGLDVDVKLTPGESKESEISREDIDVPVETRGQAVEGQTGVSGDADSGHSGQNEDSVQTEPSTEPEPLPQAGQEEELEGIEEGGVEQGENGEEVEQGENGGDSGEKEEDGEKKEDKDEEEGEDDKSEDQDEEQEPNPDGAEDGDTAGKVDDGAGEGDQASGQDDPGPESGAQVDSTPSGDEPSAEDDPAEKDRSFREKWRAGKEEFEKKKQRVNKQLDKAKQAKEAIKNAPEYAKQKAKEKAKKAAARAAKYAARAAANLARSALVAILPYILPVLAFAAIAFIFIAMAMIALCMVPAASKVLGYCASIGISETNAGSSGGGGGWTGQNPIGGSIASIALSQVGVREVPPGSNSGPQISKYFEPGGRVGDPWCSYFATWVYGQAGHAQVGSLPFRGSSMQTMSYFRENQAFISRENILNGAEQPQEGDLIFYERGTANDGLGHVGVVVGYDPATKTVSTVEGNVGNASVGGGVLNITCPIAGRCARNGTNGVFGIGRMRAN